jgi:hypothetical protein
MSHNIPIRFRFIKIPVAWTVVDGPKGRTVLCGQLQKWKSPEEVKLTELDGWDCRAEFLDLPENDLATLTGFLNKVGVWSPDANSPVLRYWERPLYVQPEDIWHFREDLKAALIYRKHFMSGVAPALPRPKTLLDLIRQPHPANDFPLHFELTEVVAGVVTISNARHMLFATVLADTANDIRFKICKRKDCGKAFPIESEHERTFCSQYCGHLSSVRKKRERERRKRKTRTRLRSKAL